MLRCSLLTLLGLPCAQAQLVVSPLVDAQEFGKSQPLESEEAPPAAGVQHPTLCDSSVKQFSGYFPTGIRGTKYFFWLFESRSDPANDPLVMWLTGGPGCSSQLALLAENGPCSVGKDGSTKKNDYSWNAKANVMWVDQPAGTGFSTGAAWAEHNESQVGENMFGFLQNFFASPELSKFAKSAFFVFGESYAGHYVPAVSHRIWQGNRAKEGVHINFQGLGIGNGLVDPAEQYKWYADMAKDGGKSEGGTLEKGVITSGVAIAAMKAASHVCTAAIDKCNAGVESMCTVAYATCNYGEVVPYQLTGMNPYDMRIKCEHGRLCYDFSHVSDYLNSAEVKKELGVSKSWESCNLLVNLGFQRDWMHNFHTLLPDMLADGIRVLIYAGDVDYICNWLGNKKWTLAMEWPHKADYNAAADVPYTLPSGGEAVGRLRTANGFSFMQVYQAGHMVPMDKPEVALDMLDRFLSNKMEAPADLVV